MRNCRVQMPVDKSCIIVGVICAVIYVVIVSVTTTYIVDNCMKAPGIEFENFDIQRMDAFRSVTATNLIAWVVSSDIHLALSVRNRNAVARCFIKLRRMEVSVNYARNSTILTSRIPLDFTLKPGNRRNVSAQLQESLFQMTEQSAGAALAADLQNNDNITLQLEIATRYLVSDRVSKWIRTVCEFVAKTPQFDTTVGPSIIDKHCMSIPHK